MRRTGFLLLTASLTTLLLSGTARADAADVLLDRAAQREVPAAAGEPAAEDAQRQEHRALRAQMALDLMALELTAARLEILEGNDHQARQRLEWVAQSLEQFPRELADVSAYEQRLSELQRQTAPAPRPTGEAPEPAPRQSAPRVEPGPVVPPPAPLHPPVPAPSPRVGDALDRDIDLTLRRLETSELVVNEPYVHLQQDPDAIRRRTLADRACGLYRGQYNPARSLIDHEALLELNAQRVVYDVRMRQLREQLYAEQFVQVEEAAVAPLSLLTYPADWGRIVQRRQRWEDGVTARTEPVVGPDGRTYYTAMYDVRDLLAPVPHMPATFSLNLAEITQDAQDRTALRRRSFIFNGPAEELARGLPLLGYFGGLNSSYYGGIVEPYELRRARLLQTIQTFMGR